MKHVRYFTALIAAICTLIVSIPLFAQQSSPGFTYGQVPSAAQWNSYFAGKLDYNAGGLPVLLGGTGATNGTDGIYNLAGSVANSGYVLRGNGTRILLAPIQAGDVPGTAGGTLGAIPYQSGVSASTYLAGNTSTTANFLTSTGSAGVATAPTYTSSTGTGNVVLASSPTMNTATLITPILGTPVSGTLTNATGLPISTGVSGLGTGIATFLGTPTSANLASAITNETGTGLLVFASTPTLNTPTIAASTLTGTHDLQGTLSGTGVTSMFTNNLVSPPPIGGTTPNTGAFTTLAASSTVSGAGFSTYLASPPAIGGTAASTVKTTTLTVTAAISMPNVLISATAPTVSGGSCGGGTSGASAPNGTAAFRVTIGNTVSACTVSLPTATTGWNCFASNTTTLTNAWQIKMSASSTTGVTLTNYSAGVATNWTNNDVLAVSCFAY